ncbi:hypothetical protein [Streptomyces jeddahensis]|uniref:Secreted protein n=1 Tax=Streptomyces jeddahensis TaxID=1716141 RepID=A0A177I0G4_9ACTN|nr:hypothetical protein [Streptomyces jeddahensis]OAH15898.1 hypothetical protein STSP_07640 [Streptomyces jeddahensis]
MRKILATAATLGLASLGAIVPASSAQASTTCDNAWHSTGDGYFRAYEAINCNRLLGTDKDNDTNWADSVGGFRGSANDAATSLLHKGTSGMAVKVYQHKSYGGGHICLTKAELYMDAISGFKYTNGAEVNNSISSHQWVWNSDCGKFLDD